MTSTAQRVELHLEAFGLHLVEDLHVLGGRDHEVVEDAGDDRAAALLRQDQHLDHPIAGGVGELGLHHLERRDRAEHPRAASGSELKAARRGGGPVSASVTSACPTRTAGGQRRADVAQSVGPRGLQLPHAARGVDGRSRPGAASPPPPRARVRPARCRSRSRSPRTRRGRPRATRTRTGSATPRPRPGPATSRADAPTGRLPGVQVRHSTGRPTRCPASRTQNAPTASAATSVTTPSPAAPMHVVHAGIAHAVETCRQRRRQRAGPPERGTRVLAHEERLDGEVVAQCRHHRGDLDDAPADAFGVAVRSRRRGRGARRRRATPRTPCARCAR